MLKKTLATLGFIALIWGNSSAFANTNNTNAHYFLTGEDLHRLCSSSYDTEYGYCAGYITGIASVLFETYVDGMQACNHATVRSEQFIENVRLYIETRPETKGEIARHVVADALSRAFPCQKLIKDDGAEPAPKG